jgi:formylglycine-generating enzyme required for sulfatase activity
MYHLMGSQDSDNFACDYQETVNYDESPVHKMKVSSFGIGETEVSQALWKAVMNSNLIKFSSSSFSDRVLRGGSRNFSGRSCRVSDRGQDKPNLAVGYYGLRLVCGLMSSESIAVNS